MKKQRQITLIELKLSKRKKRIKTDKPPKIPSGQRVLMPHIAQPEFEPGWKEAIPPVKPEQFFKLLQVIIDNHGATTHGSYNFSVKFNDGYGKNHDTGATITGSFSGPLNEIYTTLRCSGIEHHGK